MNENLIQALNAYTSTLEQQLAALEARVGQLEEQLSNVTALNTAANLQIGVLQTQVEALSATQATAQNAEPEVEIELILDDETEEIEETAASIEATVEETIEQAIEETTEEIVPETATEEIPTIEQTSEEETIAEPTSEELTIEEPTIEETVKEEPAKEEHTTPVQHTIPTQTTLFGPAVTDIRQAISLGDRFLFQRELFAGNGELMQHTLDDLNQLASYEEALAYIQEKFSWDIESTAVKLFDNVLKRRF
jgi:hypothetical protein